MSNVPYKKKLARLGEHFKVSKPAGDDLKAWSDAIKKAAGRAYSAIDDIYDDTFNVRAQRFQPEQKPEPDKTVTVGTSISRIEDAKVEMLPSHTNVEGAQQRVDVQAAQLAFHLAPAQVTINPGDVTWAYFIQQLGHKAFIFGSGAMFGLLVAIVAFKGRGG